jgi:hypothetical protein
MDGQSRWVLPLALLIGVVIGGYLGELIGLLADMAEWLGFLNWFNYGFDFGFSSPFTLNLGVVTLTFGITIKFTLCGLLGMAAAALLSRKL